MKKRVNDFCKEWLPRIVHSAGSIAQTLLHGLGWIIGSILYIMVIVAGYTLYTLAMFIMDFIGWSMIMGVILGAIAVAVNMLNGAGMQYMTETVWDILKVAFIVAMFTRGANVIKDVNKEMEKYTKW